MSALYAMQYVGNIGLGAGAVYVGKGIVLGADVGGGRYKGSYTEQGSNLALKVTLTVPNGATLVTGAVLPPGSQLQLTATWPKDFGNGKPQNISVQGAPVQVVFEKVGDIP